MNYLWVRQSSSNWCLVSKYWYFRVMYVNIVCVIQMQAVSDIVCTNESFTTKINIIHVSNTFVFKDGRFKFGIIYHFIKIIKILLQLMLTLRGETCCYSRTAYVKQKCSQLIVFLCTTRPAPFQLIIDQWPPRRKEMGCLYDFAKFKANVISLGPLSINHWSMITKEKGNGPSLWFRQI